MRFSRRIVAVGLQVVLALCCLAAGHAPRAVAQELPKRLEAAWKAVAQYEAGRPYEELLTDELLALVRLKLEKAQLLLENYNAARVLEDELGVAEKILPVLGKVKTPLPLKPGLHELAYLADNDLSAQPYLLYIPSTYSPDRPAPLLVFLHGYASYLDKVNWMELMYSPDLQDLMEKLGFLLLLPFGRSNTEFMGIGEVDVLRSIELVKQRCNVDADRVFMSGASMGGSGAYTIACHYPDLFAGVMAIAGRYDYYLWKELDPDKLAGFKRIQTDLDYARALAPNLCNVKTFIFHGSADFLVQPEQSRGLFRALSALGFSVTYKEFKDESHWIWSKCFAHEPFGKWLAETRRDPKPKRVEYRTYNLRYHRAYWATIADVEKWGPEASVSAQCGDDGALKLETKNVAALTLNLADLPKPTKIHWNGKEHAGEIPADGKLALGNAAAASPLRKTPTLCGPARDALNSRFLFVYGTGGDDDAQKTNLEIALNAANQWKRFSAGRARVMADSKVSDADLKSQNLLLVGTPADNSVMARLGDAFPIKWSKERYTLGHRSFPAEGNGLLAIYPSPFAADKYVLVNSGILWGAHLSINHKWDFVPDFIIFNNEKDWDDNNKYVCAGYFDKNWQVDDSLIWLGQDEKRAEKGR